MAPMTHPEGNQVEPASAAPSGARFLKYLDRVMPAGGALKARLGNPNRDFKLYQGKVESLVIIAFINGFVVMMRRQA